MGIPIMGPTNIFCDNQSVVNNSTKPESVLKKKHLSICYHKVRECCAKGAARIAYKPTVTNLTDISIKVLPGKTRTVMWLPSILTVTIESLDVKLPSLLNKTCVCGRHIL